MACCETSLSPGAYAFHRSVSDDYDGSDDEIKPEIYKRKKQPPHHTKPSKVKAPRKPRVRQSSTTRKPRLPQPGASLPESTRAIFSRHRKRHGISHVVHWTQEEARAWPLRPYGCHSLTVALETYRKKAAFNKLQDNSFLRVMISKPLRDLPEHCHPHEHPLHTGRRDTLYSRSDFVTPVIDAMTDTLQTRDTDVFGLSQMLNRQNKRRRANEQHNQMLNREIAKRDADKHAFTCSGCGTHDSSGITKTLEGLVCRCGVVCGSNFVSSNRQKLGASQQDDNTVVADNPIAYSKDKYDSGPATSKEARRELLRRGRENTSSTGGKRAGNGLGALSHAQNICDRQATKDIIESEVRNGIGLQPRDRIKQRSVLKELEDHFKTVGLTFHPLKRLIRIKTDKIYLLSVQHTYNCKDLMACDLRLNDRHASSIACACFHYEVGRLLQLLESNIYADELENLDVRLLRDVQNRIKRSAVLQLVLPQNQLIVSLQIIKSIDDPKFDFSVQCELCSDEQISYVETPSFADRQNSSEEQSVQVINPLTIPSITGMNRCSSLCSNGSESPGPCNATIEMRNAINTIFTAHRSEVKVRVKQVCLKLITTTEILEQSKSDSTLSTLDSSQFAFCLISSANQVLNSQSQTVSFANRIQCKYNIALSNRLGMEPETVETAIQLLKSMIPEDLVASGIGSSLTKEKTCNDLFD